MARCHPRRWFYSFHIRSPPPTDPFLIFVSTLIEFPFLLFSFAVYMLQDQEAHAAEMERTFIAIKPDGVQRGLVTTTCIASPT
jgi:hypothetical protein